MIQLLLVYGNFLNKCGVRYILVGGFATNFHGFQRYTGNVDLYIDDTRENQKRFRQAYADYGMGEYESIETMQFVSGWINFPLGNGIKLDIQTSLKAVSESLKDVYKWRQHLPSIMFRCTFFILIICLPTNGRPLDPMDATELEKIKRINE